MESVAEFGARFERWLDGRTIPVVPLDLDERVPVLRGWQRELHAAGFVGVDWPVDYGGQGLSLLHEQALTRLLVAHQTPFPANRVGLEVIGPTLIKFASPQFCDQVLPGMLSGEEIWCIGLSEPGVGSDLGSVATYAEAAGEDYLVNGQKVWSSFATFADWCAVLVRTDRTRPGPRGLSYLAVRLDSPGVTVRPITQATGDHEFCEIFFTDVRVPRSQLIGAPGDGWKVVSHSLGGERGKLSMRRHAELSSAVTELVTQFARSGRLGGESDLEQLGTVAVRLAVLGAQLERTAARLMANGGAASVYDSADKWQLSLTEQSIYQHAVRLLGPARSHPEALPGIDVPRWLYDYLYSRAASLYSGTDQIQANIIGETVLGLPGEPRGDLHAG
jgi:alkylation response protein AidB-like acyl-CoA dehydrogenase